MSIDTGPFCHNCLSGKVGDGLAQEKDVGIRQCIIFGRIPKNAWPHQMPFCFIKSYKYMCNRSDSRCIILISSNSR